MLRQIMQSSVFMERFIAPVFLAVKATLRLRCHTA